MVIVSVVVIGSLLRVGHLCCERLSYMPFFQHTLDLHIGDTFIAAVTRNMRKHIVAFTKQTFANKLCSFCVRIEMAGNPGGLKQLHLELIRRRVLVIFPV
jgi:hypothetical protein